MEERLPVWVRLYFWPFSVGVEGILLFASFTIYPQEIAPPCLLSIVANALYYFLLI